MDILSCGRDILSVILLLCSPVELYNLRRTNKFFRDFVSKCCYTNANGIRTINGKRWGFYKDAGQNVWITDTFSIWFMENETTYFQGNLKISYRENETKAVTSKLIYSDVLNLNVRNVTYLIGDRYCCDRYLYIYDRLVIYSIDGKSVTVYSAVNGKILTVNPELQIVEFHKDIEPKTPRGRDTLVKKILKIVYKSETGGISTGKLESFLKTKPFFDML